MDQKLIQEQSDNIKTTLDKIIEGCGFDLDTALGYAFEASANIGNIIAELHREEGRRD